MRFPTLSNYPTYVDEVITIYAAKGIVQTGLPVMESGLLYIRAPLNSYLTAIPVLLFGDEIKQFAGSLTPIFDNKDSQVYFFPKHFRELILKIQSAKF